MTHILKSTHEGTLRLGETKLKVAVLEDGTRIISRNAIFKAFGRTKRGRKIGELREPNMPSFIDAKNLQPFIGADLRGGLNVMDYTEKTGRPSTGYNALILPLLCKVYLDARAANGTLKSQQLPLARASEILLVAISQVGIIALVDEVTGYNRKQEKGLQNTVQSVINQEMNPPSNVLDLMQLALNEMRNQNTRLSVVENKMLQIEANTTRSDYFTAAGYANIIGVKHCPIKMASDIGRMASRICRKRNIPMDKTPDPRFGTVNMYPAEILKEVFVTLKIEPANKAA